MTSANATRPRQYAFPSLPRLLAPLNDTLVPLLRLGVANPPPLGVGLAVLEIRGRKTGRRYDVPLVCIATLSGLTVTTVRDRSQWFRNLAAMTQVDVWLWGTRRRFRPVTCTTASGLRVARLVPA